MPTTHTWKPANTGYALDPANFVDGLPFAPGDTLVVNAGHLGAAAVAGIPLAALSSGAFILSETGGSNEDLTFSNIVLDGLSSITETGPQKLYWYAQNQFVNNGLIQVGTTASAGSVYYDETATTTKQQSQLTNSGTILLQNASLFDAYSDSAGSTLLNNPGGVVSVNSGSLFNWGAYLGADYARIANVANNGLIAVNGAAGRTTTFEVQGDLSGSGILSVRGAAGAVAGTTSAMLYGTSNAAIDVANGKVEFYGKSSGGTITFLDGNGYLSITSTADPVIGATLVGFQAGDTLHLGGFQIAVSNIHYDAPSRVLTLNDSNGSVAAQFTLAGKYAIGDFALSSSDGGASGWNITTTSTANAVPAFAFQDVITGAKGSSVGQQYSGPVNYLQSQYIWAGSDSVNVVTSQPNSFVLGGSGNDAIAVSAGSNVLDGGLGSNFLTGATGAHGGRDTFFLDGSTGTTWDTIVNFHAGDSVTLWGFVPGQSTLAWAANEGVPGYTGATIHAAFAGAGAPINGSVTFAGLSLADAQSKLSLTLGSVGGRSYLYAHYNG